MHDKLCVFMWLEVNCVKTTKYCMWLSHTCTAFMLSTLTIKSTADSKQSFIPGDQFTFYLFKWLDWTLFNLISLNEITVNFNLVDMFPEKHELTRLGCETRLGLYTITQGCVILMALTCLLSRKLFGEMHL